MIDHQRNNIRFKWTLGIVVLSLAISFIWFLNSDQDNVQVVVPVSIGVTSKAGSLEPRDATEIARIPIGTVLENIETRFDLIFHSRLADSNCIIYEAYPASFNGVPIQRFAVGLCLDSLEYWSVQSTRLNRGALLIWAEQKYGRPSLKQDKDGKYLLWLFPDSAALLMDPINGDMSTFGLMSRYQYELFAHPSTTPRRKYPPRPLVRYSPISAAATSALDSLKSILKAEITWTPEMSDRGIKRAKITEWQDTTRIEFHDLLLDYPETLKGLVKQIRAILNRFDIGRHVVECDILSLTTRYPFAEFYIHDDTVVFIDRYSECTRLYDQLEGSRAKQRREWAHDYEIELLNTRNVDTKFETYGKDGRCLRITYILMNRVFANNTIRDYSFREEARSWGFTKVQFSDGYGFLAEVELSAYPQELRIIGEKQ